MADFYSMRSDQFPNRTQTRPGDVYFGVDNRELYIVIPGGDLIPIDQLWSGNANVQIISNGQRTAVINAVFDSGGPDLVLQSGPVFPIKFPCTITSVMLLADSVGDAAIDIQKTQFSQFPSRLESIFSTTKPNLSQAQTGIFMPGVTPNFWDTQLNVDDVLQFMIDSAAGISRLTVALTVSIP